MIIFLKIFKKLIDGIILILEPCAYNDRFVVGLLNKLVWKRNIIQQNNDSRPIISKKIPKTFMCGVSALTFLIS